MVLDGMVSETDKVSLGTLLLSLVRTFNWCSKVLVLRPSMAQVETHITVPSVSSACDKMSATDCRRGVPGSFATLTASERLALCVFLMPVRSMRSVREPHVDVSGFRYIWSIHFAHSFLHLCYGISI